MSKYLTREQILTAKDTQYEDVHVSEWGGTVRVRGLGGTERDAFEESMMTGKGMNKEFNIRGLRARLVSLSIVDENDKKLFSEKDVAELGRKSAIALQRVYDVAQRLAGISKADEEELVNALKGNEESGEDSLSDSPDTFTAPEPNYSHGYPVVR